MAFEEELNALVQRTKVNDENPSRTASYGAINGTIGENKKRHEVWMNDVDIFYNKYLKEHPLSQKIDTWLFQRKYDQLVAALESISGDKDFINKISVIERMNRNYEKNKNMCSSYSYSCDCHWYIYNNGIGG